MYILKDRRDDPEPCIVSSSTHGMGAVQLFKAGLLKVSLGIEDLHNV